MSRAKSRAAAQSTTGITRFLLQKIYGVSSKKSALNSMVCGNADPKVLAPPELL